MLYFLTKHRENDIIIMYYFFFKDKIMKILFAFLGGTIGSTLSGEYIAPDAQKSRVLIDAYSKKHGIDFEYDVIEPFSSLSENNTGIELAKIISFIRNVSGYDGIIVAHGTDTLQYTSAALGYYFGNVSVPICIVSSNYPIEDERANGLYNLYGAVALIKSQNSNGVFVSYRNGNENIIRIHRATRLLSHDAFSDTLRSAKGKEYGLVELGGEFCKSLDFFEREDEISAPSVEMLSLSANNILRLHSYVGMNYPTLPEEIKYVLIDSYHSGTINTKDPSAKDFFFEAQRRGIKVFMSGAYDGAQYLSTSLFDELSIIPVSNIAPIALYMKLWFYSLERDVDAKILKQSRGGDIC